MGKIVCCDFDGTITDRDVLDTVMNNAIENNYSDVIDELVIKEGRNLNMLLKETFDKLNISKERIIEIISDIKIDNTFNGFYNYCISNNIPFYVVSAGFKFFINNFVPFIPNENIISNDIYINNNQIETILYDDQIEKGIYKKNIIANIRNIYPDDYLIFIGDGVSDIDIVDCVDLLFVKRNKTLHKFCIDNNKKHIVFDIFDDIKYYIN